MDIQILDVEVQQVPQKKDPSKCWEKAIVTFRDLGDDVIKAQNVVSFRLPSLFKKVTQLEKNDLVTVKMEMGDGGYWEWTELHKTGEGGWEQETSPESPGQFTQTVARQSSLSTAVKLLGVGASVKAVIDLAETFNDYIMNGVKTIEVEKPSEKRSSELPVPSVTEEEPVNSRDEAFIDMTDDIPF